MKKVVLLLALFSSLVSAHGQVSFYAKDTILLSKHVTPTVPIDYDLDGYSDLIFLKNDALFMMKNLEGDSLGRSEWLADLPVKAAGTELAGADFDNDGFTDLLYKGEVGSGEVILFGSATGFGSSWVSAGVNFSQIGTIIDFDGDGDMDILRLGFSAVAYIKNLGNRNFEIDDSWIPLTNDKQFWGLNFADLNNNGIADIAAVTSSIGSNTDFSIDVYFDPDGSAGDPDLRLDQFGSNYPRPLFGDLNLDGLLDMSVIGNTDVTSLINNGTTFESVETSYDNYSISDNGILFDVDKDGRLDMLVQNQGLGISYVPGNGDGSFDPMKLMAEDVYYGKLSVADFDNDSTFDIVVDNPFNYLTSVIRLKQGEALMEKRINSPKAPGLSDFLFADANTDGITDMLVIGGNGALFIYPGNLDGFNPEPEIVEIPLDAGKMNIAEINQDQIPDILFTRQTPNNSVSEILYMTGVGGFQFSEPHPFKHFPNPARPQVIDLFNDGNPELLQRQLYSPFSIFLLSLSEDYDEYSKNPPKVIPSTGNFLDYRIADFDKDGFSDVFMYNYYNSGLLLFRNNKTNGFDPQIKIDTGDSIFSATVNDFNADGILDIALVTLSESNAKVKIYQGDGSFGFTKSYELETNTYVGLILSADLDNNGLVDLIISEYNEGQHLVLENMGDQEFELKEFDLYYNLPTLAYVGNSELPDIVLTSSDNGIVFVGRNNSVQEIKSLSSEILSATPGDSSVVFTLNEIEGKERFFLMREAGAMEATPSDGVFYASNTTFGLGQKFADDSYAVFAGTDTVITVTALKPNTAYHVAIYEYASNVPEGDLINYFQAEPILFEFTTDRIHQVITFANNRLFSLEEESFTADVTADSGLPVTLEVVDGPISIVGLEVTFTGAGQATMKALQEGNEQYSPLEAVFSIEIDKIHQQLVYEEIRDHVVNEDPFEINIQSTSGLPVSLELQEGPISITGNVASITGQGMVTIKAIQPGDERHHSVDSLFIFEIIDIYTSVDDPDDQVVVFPNPVEHLISLQFPSDKYVTGAIYSIDGRRLLETELEHTGEQSLEVSGLKRGVYLLVLKSGSQTTTYRFIKN